MGKVIYKYHCFDDKLLSNFVVQKPAPFEDLDGVVSFSRRDMIRSLRLGSDSVVDHSAVLSFWCPLIRYVKRYAKRTLLVTNEMKVPISFFDALFLPSDAYEGYKEYAAHIGTLKIQANNARKLVFFCDSDQDFVDKFAELCERYKITKI